MELGRYLERAGATAALLEVQYRDCSWETNAGVSEYAEWVGRVEVVLRVRSLLPPLHRRLAAAAYRRVPDPQQRLPAIDSLLGGADPGVAESAGVAARAPRESRRPFCRTAAGVTRLRPDRRDRRRHRTPTCRASRDRHSSSTPPSNSSTLPTRSTATWRSDRCSPITRSGTSRRFKYDSPVSESVMELQDAAGHRRPAAVPAVRSRRPASGAGVRLSRLARQLGPPFRHATPACRPRNHRARACGD